MIPDCNVLVIPDGCKIHENVSFVDTYTALNEILVGEKQFKYTSAQIIGKDDVCRLTEHFVECNKCGQQTPAYNHFINGIKPPKRINREYASLISLEVASLFEKKDKFIPLYTPITEKDRFRCMHCGAESKFSDRKSMVIIRKKGNKLTVSRTLADIGDIVGVNWASGIFSINEIPLYERITFNLSKGTTHIILKTFSGKLLAAKDITNGVDESTDFTSPLLNLISDNTVVKRTLRKRFAELWGKSLPFKEAELDIHKFALATAFIGYDADFYSYIPRDSHSALFDKSYKNMRKKMHYANNLEKLLEDSSLDQKKSVKRTMYRTPALFFYLNEIEALWQMSREPNFFCDLLSGDRAFSLLSFLHDCPQALALYRDICNDKKLLVPFKETLYDYPREVNEYAVAYSSFSERKRRQAMTRIKKTNCRCLRCGSNTDEYFYSIPPAAIINIIQTQRVNNYLFTPLRTVSDYNVAGQHLCNCLGREEFDSPIVGVVKDGKYVAAIEVDVTGNYIVQAYLKNNRNIDKDKQICEAFLRWCKSNSYSLDEIDDFGGFDRMPF